jgi:ribosome-binding factor A
LNSASGYLQREIGRKFRMKFTPRLRFHVDMEGEQALAMNALLDRIRIEGEEE